MTGSDRAVDSDADCTSLRTALVMLQAGETNLTLDAGFYVLNPTGVHLSEFKASMVPDGVKVSWRTSLERGTFGFNVLRSMNGERSHAIRVNAELVPAKGLDGGANYSLLDKGGAVNATYWLEEVELNGTVIDYEPVKVVTNIVPPPPLPTPVPEWVKGAIPGGIPVAAAPANAMINAPAAQPQPAPAPAAQPALQPQPAVIAASTAQPVANPAGTNAAAVETVAERPAAQTMQPPPAQPTQAPAMPSAMQAAPAVERVAQASEPRVAHGALKAIEVPRSGVAAEASYTAPSRGFLSVPSQAWFLITMGLMAVLCITGGVVIYMRKLRQLAD
jgi:hypothetical protein